MNQIRIYHEVMLIEPEKNIYSLYRARKRRRNGTGLYEAE